MARSNSPETDHPASFRAPPPSPVHSGRRSSVANDEFLTDFLENSLRVPSLILPDSVFPRQRRIAAPAVVDLRSAGSGAAEIAAEAVAEIGCFQVAGHGISGEAARAAAAAGVFAVPAENRSAAARSPEMPYGFEEEEEEKSEGEFGDFSEEFVWSVDQAFNSLMEGIWPPRYSYFRKQMEILLTDIEKVGERVLSMIFQKNPPTSTTMEDSNETFWQGNNVHRGTLCCLYKNNITSCVGNSSESLRHEGIRMLVKRNEHSHALCLHICGGSSEFHVYSKKGWFSFCPQKDALVVTIGDQIQTWSGGKYKHVIGRPIFKDEEECISMAFLYSPQNITNPNSKSPTARSEKIISLNQQVILAITLTLVYQFLAYVCQKF